MALQMMLKYILGLNIYILTFLIFNLCTGAIRNCNSKTSGGEQNVQYMGLPSVSLPASSSAMEDDLKSKTTT